MVTDLSCLEMSEARREEARQEIQKMAYFKWVDAGCPECDPLKYWREAELQWIGSEYVPDRPFEEFFDAAPQAMQLAPSHELVCTS